MRKWLIRISLVLLSLLLTLGVAELVVRKLAPQDNFIFGMSIYESDPDADYRLAANVKTVQGKTVLRTNSLGFRGRDVARRKPDGVTRVVCLGDSVTFGLGLAREETPYPSQLERLLNQGLSQPRYEVLNAGISGYGTDQEVATLRSRILELEPDVVTIGFFASNDVTDNMYRGEKEAYQGLLLTVREDRTIPFDARMRAAIHRALIPFHLYRFLLLRWKAAAAAPPTREKTESRPAPTQKMHDFLRQPPPAPARAPLEEDSGGLDPSRRDELPVPAVGSSGYKAMIEDALNRTLAVFHTTPNALLEELAWPNTFQVLREARDLAARHHFKLYVLLLPDRLSVDDANRDLILAKLGDDGQDLDFELPLERMTRFLQEERIAAIELLPALRAAQQERPVYLPDDRHLSAWGCEVVARELAKALAH